MRSLALYVAWLVAIAAMAGSLYFSEVRHFIPCIFCWYQRILMYPLVLILGIASARQDRGILWYALPLSLSGIGLAGYHYLVQKVPAIQSDSCGVGVPCSHIYLDTASGGWAGFITIPFLSLTAFVLITGLLLIFRSSPAPSSAS